MSKSYERHEGQYTKSSIVFSHTDHEQALKCQDKNLIYNRYKNIKYLGVNLTKEATFIENYKTLMKETQDTKIKGKISCVHDLKELALFKVHTIHK